jgi:hypothetical protein
MMGPAGFKSIRLDRFDVTVIRNEKYVVAKCAGTC